MTFLHPRVHVCAVITVWAFTDKFAVGGLSHLVDGACVVERSCFLLRVVVSSMGSAMAAEKERGGRQVRRG
ncbi:hypothetical protein BDV98DRAFT_566275 [Pterulicium gracile]|uniref:Uncharacterized protein n=1 Tax=Pterulicium gracile TaxID=1884261 RepID=A0A5C3QLQ8_9AGAR|nr:hypothetical protein BDV98DRAFT_566275 [Pterula gracilis]